MSAGSSREEERLSFRNYIKSGSYYVDKTEFIAKFINYPASFESPAISRPKGSGKTTNLEMLQEFFSINADSSDIFDSSWTIMGNEYKTFRDKYMNKVPVVFLSLSALEDAPSFIIAKQRFHEQIKELFEKFRYLEASDKLDDYNKNGFKEILNQPDYSFDTEYGIVRLCKCLALHHGKYPILIIDAVDSPFTASIAGDYFDPMSASMRVFLATSLKSDRVFAKAIIAGIVPISDWLPDNIKVHTISDDSWFDSSFGLTEQEVTKLLAESGEKQLMENITQWYTHFRIGENPLYNPFSIMECRRHNWEIKTFATQTRLLQRSLSTHLFEHSGLIPPLNVQLLIRNVSLKKSVAPARMFHLKDLLESESMMWSYFLHAGIITIEKYLPSKDGWDVIIRLPGLDIRNMLNRDVIDPLLRRQMIPNYTRFIADVEKGHLEAVCRTLKLYIEGAGAYLKSGPCSDPMQDLKQYIKLIVKRWAVGEDEIKGEVIITRFYGKSHLWTVRILRKSDSMVGEWEKVKSSLYGEIVVNLKDCVVTITEGESWDRIIEPWTWNIEHSFSAGKEVTSS